MASLCISKQCYFNFQTDSIKSSTSFLSFKAFASSNPLIMLGKGVNFALQWRSVKILTASVFQSLIARTKGVFPQLSISFLSTKITPSYLQLTSLDMSGRFPSKTALWSGKDFFSEQKRARPRHTRSSFSAMKALINWTGYVLKTFCI